MRCKIAGNLVDTNDINVIAVDGTYFMRRMAEYHVTVRLKNGEKIDFTSVASFGDAQRQVVELIKFFQTHGLDNFAVLDDQFVINMDNARRLSWKSNALGVNVVELICPKRIYTLYKGMEELYAESLAAEYLEQEEKYLQTKQPE